MLCVVDCVAHFQVPQASGMPSPEAKCDNPGHDERAVFDFDTADRAYSRGTLNSRVSLPFRELRPAALGEELGEAPQK